MNEKYRNIYMSTNISLEKMIKMVDDWLEID
jgi:hypothetical protein